MESGRPVTIPGLSPKMDQHFLNLLESAVAGTTPVYFAAVPLALCVPYDLDYRPDLHPVGEAAIQEAVSRAERGDFGKIITYQRGAWFVVSDDYIPLFAALLGLPDYVPCWVLEKPHSDLVRDVQGPIRATDVQRLVLGGT